MEEKTLEEIIARYDSPTGKVLGILGDIQRSEGYIPRETLEMLSVKIDVRISPLYSIVTFYSFFSLKPVGEHVITICMGTACHVRGAVGVLDALESLLDIHGDTTEDGKFSVTTKDNKFTVRSPGVSGHAAWRRSSRSTAPSTGTRTRILCRPSLNSMGGGQHDRSF